MSARENKNVHSQRPKAAESVHSWLRVEQPNLFHLSKFYFDLFRPFRVWGQSSRHDQNTYRGWGRIQNMDPQSMDHPYGPWPMDHAYGPWPLSIFSWILLKFGIGCHKQPNLLWWNLVFFQWSWRQHACALNSIKENVTSCACYHWTSCWTSSVRYQGVEKYWGGGGKWCLSPGFLRSLFFLPWKPGCLICKMAAFQMAPFSE